MNQPESPAPPEVAIPAISARQQIAAALALAAVLDGYRAVIERNEAGVLDNADIEHLHDFRIAVRRTRSILKHLGHLCEPVQLACFREDFSRLAKATGPQRDLDVFLSQFDEHVASLTMPAAAFEPLRVYLKRRQRLAHRKLARTLRSQRHLDLKAAWPAFLAAAAATPQPEGHMPVLPAAGAAIGRAYHEVLKIGGSIRPRSRIDRLHELRKNCKELRYLLEAFRELYDAGDIATLIKALKRLQDNLGEICDLEVQRGLVADLHARVRSSGDLMLRQDMANWERMLRKRQRGTREEFAERFERFTKKRNRRLFSRLFGEFAT